MFKISLATRINGHDLGENGRVVFLLQVAPGYLSSQSLSSHPHISGTCWYINYLVG